MYQQVWSVTCCQLYLSYLLCIDKFGLSPSASCIWVTFCVSTSLVCHLLPVVSELPSMYQQVWSVTFCQLYLSYLLCINKFGLPPSASCIWVTFHVSTSLVCHLLPFVSELPSMYQQVWSVTFHVPTSLVCHLLPVDKVHVSELPSVYQQVWSATFCQLYLSYLLCINKFGLPPSASCIWVTFYVSTSLVCHLLPVDKVHVSELPSMYQQVWSATFCQLYLSYLLCINKFGLPPSASCIWVTFYVSTSLVCHLLPVVSELPSMYQQVWSATYCQLYLSYLLCINKFGLPPTASCPVNRNVNDKECLPLVSVSKGCTSVFEV